MYAVGNVRGNMNKPKGVQWERWNTVTDERIIAAYKDYSIEWIAERFGISYECVRLVLIRNGVERRAACRPRKAQNIVG